MDTKKSKEQVGRAGRLPTQPEIAGRAFELFLERGGQHGRSLEDWLQAEQELGCGQAPRQAASNRPLGLRLLA